MENKIIRAADYLPKPEESGDDSHWDSFEMTSSERILFGIFGETPDYGNPEMEKIWQTILDGDNEETIRFCREKGVDLLGDDGKPVSGWRDIAVMLTAIDKGILRVVGKE